jgi:hypothetical protein
MRPRGADSFQRTAGILPASSFGKNISPPSQPSCGRRQKTSRQKTEDEEGIADRRLWIEEKATYSSTFDLRLSDLRVHSRFKFFHLFPFDVQCWAFDVRCSLAPPPPNNQSQITNLSSLRVHSRPFAGQTLQFLPLRCSMLGVRCSMFACSSPPITNHK